jgi:hypothetical protein
MVQPFQYRAGAAVMQFTHGGLIPSEAWHWNKETYQKLGHVVFLITDSRPEKQREGYQCFFALRRFFLPDEWQSQIDRVDEFRKERLRPSLSEIIARVQQELIKNGTEKIAYQSGRDMPETYIFDQAGVSKSKNEIDGEQLSLF